MAKMTLLEMVQDILSDMNSDNVNSISDTIESEQVAQILKSTYYELLSGKNWPFMRKLIPFYSGINKPSPVHVVIPDNVKEILSIEHSYSLIEFNQPPVYKKINYVEPDAFLNKSNSLKFKDGGSVSIVRDVSGTFFNIRKDKSPSFYTSFDDKFIVFDSYDESKGKTILGSDIRALCYTTPSWVVEDSFIPDLPEEMFSALLAEAKSVAFLNILDYENKKAEQQAIRQRSRMSRNSWTVSGGIKLPSYGKR